MNLKTIIYLSAFITLLDIKPAEGQTYYFMNDSAEWKVDYSYIPGLYDCYNCEYKYYFSGDTIINSTLYKKLRRSTLEQGYIFTDEYEGGLRQDSISKKVWFVGGYLPVEELLYDYSLDLGDTISSKLGNDWVIFSVDSVLVGNEFHKRMNYGIGFEDTLSLIEGVGSSNGLLQNLADNTFESYAYLTCFTVSGNLLYTANQQMLDDKGCDVSDPLEVPINYVSKQISVFPNPAHDNIKVISNYHIEDITVQSLSAMEINTYTNISGEINVSNLTKGCYLMKVKTSEEIFVEILIVQ